MTGGEPLARWQAGALGAADSSRRAASDDNRHAALRAAKLAAVVASRWGPAERQQHTIGAAAGLTGTVDGEAAAWVLTQDTAGRALGPALVWAERQDAAQLHLVVDAEPGVDAVLARQAGWCAPPVPAVWRVAGSEVVAAEPAPVPSRLPAPAPPGLVDLLIDAGVEIVAEDGMVRGEVNGLEVARIVTDRTTAGVPIDAPQLEVGVGKADRELTAMLHGELAPVDQLGRVVEIVRGHRRADALRHPLNQLVPERWLRAVLLRDPGVVGLAALRPAEGPRARPNLRDRDIAVARGETSDGDPAVVVCAVGAAPDLVPLAADARAAVDPDAALLLAIPARDDLPVNRRIAARLRRPAAVVPVPDDWRR